MKILTKITSIIGILSIIVLIFVFAIKLFNPSLEFGKNEIIKKIDSPGGSYTATAFIRNCGATTPFSMQVSIQWKSDEFTNNNVGNIFISDTAASSNKQGIDIEWKNESYLVVYYQTTDIGLQVIKWGNVTIEYIKI